MSKESKYKVLILALLLWVVIITMPLAAEKVEEVLNPRQLSGSYVADGANVLGPEYIRLIDAACKDLQQKTGVELALVTVNDLGGTTIEDFADRLFRRFAIGVAGKDNGLLLLFALSDRAVRVEVGYGLESVIPDAKASQILDLSALPNFRNGLIARGLFMAVRELAQAAAGGGMFIAEPASWPEQVKLPAPLARPEPPKKKGWDPLHSSLLFAAGLLAAALLGTFWTLLRFRAARGMAARAKVISQVKAATIFVWIVAAVSLFLIFAFSGKFLTPLVAMLAAPTLATGFQLLTGSILRRRLAAYRLACRACGQPMDIVADSDDEKFLNAEEAAEEKAGGMDYEFWQCPQCGASERLAVKLGKAQTCPKCRRRTLTSSRTTLAAATASQGGKVRESETCLNPKCGYSHTVEKDTPRLGAPSSANGSSSRSSSGSFGGGRSGGGGASKHW
jgi:uncharacterized protein